MTAKDREILERHLFRCVETAASRAIRAVLDEVDRLEAENNRLYEYLCTEIRLREEMTRPTPNYAPW
ncbi:unnamed protein product [uncultured bacterium]|nr:unnamed protein product [uncultured bacterium]